MSTEQTNKASGKNVTLIGRWQIPRLWALIVLIGIILSGGSSLVIYFGLGGLERRLMSSPRLTGQVNLVIADFGEVDGQGQVRATDQGRVLSQWVYGTLKQAYATHPALANVARVEIYHARPGFFGRTVTVGPVAGKTAPLRAMAAAQLADQLGADLVVYGAISQTVPAKLTLEFYVAPRLRAEASTVIGRYRLGDPISLPQAFQADAPVDPSAVGDALAMRTTALFYLMAGLTLDWLGRPADALTLFRQAEQAVANWSAGDGKAILYFFIAREALLLAQDPAKQVAALQTAEQAAQQALAIQPADARARGILGGVYAIRAQQLPPADRLVEPSALGVALMNYTQAVTLAQQSQDIFVQSVLQWALALTLRTKGQTYFLKGDPANAHATFDQASRAIQQTIQPLTAAQQPRLLAQAYLGLGETYVQQAELFRQQGDVAQQQQQLTQARTAFTHCMEQGPQAPLDPILHEDLIAKRCQPQQAAVVQMLASNK